MHTPAADSVVKCLIPKVCEAFSTGIQNLGKGVIEQWCIRPGMEFASPKIWWGDTSKTRFDSYGGGPHEGLDFALARRYRGGPFHAKLEGLRVTALLKGTVLWHFDDLVGDTVIIASNYQVEGYRFVVQYSHIDIENVQLGDSVSLGQDIGKIKRSRNSRSLTASHLHVSTALVEDSLIQLAASSVNFENWLEWDQTGKLLYFDPLTLVSPPVIEERFLLGKLATSPLARIVCTASDKDDRNALRRTLSCNFPGIQVLSAKVSSEANAKLIPGSLQVVCDNDSWKIKTTTELFSSDSLPLTGTGFDRLIDTISKIELSNNNT